ncbi:MAG: NAD-binding protein [SAR324 cluster bacterium]|nr:NAD-binding protein [SAR324 cluster bacterium]MBL7034810.1 NAD-binding protein [SAR324 cluster bacterium]
MKIRLFLVAMLPLFLLISTFGIYFFEYILTGLEGSPFSSVFNSLWWSVVTFTTVGYGDMSPETIPGQLFTFLVMAAGLINFSIIVSLVTDKFQEFRSGRDRGLDSLKIKGHVLICSDDPTWMLDILSQNKQYVKEDKVVLISPMDEHPLLATSYKKLKWVSGDSFDLNVLRKSVASKAEIAYVYFKDNSYALMTVLQLETLSDGKIVTQAQYVGREYRNYFEDVGCDHALDPYDLYVPLMLLAFHSQGAPAWLSKVINCADGLMIATRKPGSAFIGQTWLDLIKKQKQKHGIMPLAVVIDEVVLINPEANFELPQGCLIMQLEPPATRPKGDLEEHAVEVIGMDEIGLKGHILISSDNLVFIKRCLFELSLRKQQEKIVVLSDIPLLEEIPANLNVEWIEGDSNSEKSFLQAKSTEAKVALIDHADDGQNLMSVLRLEQATDGEVFTIASFHKEDFDQQLFKVGCDFCLDPEELIAPILSQSALNPGLGTLIEEVILEESKTQSLHVRHLSQDWQPASWLSTIVNLKEKEEKLPVGLIRSQSHKLLVNPHPDIQVNPGDRLIYIAPVSAADLEIGYEEESDEDSDQDQAATEPSEVAEKLFRRGLQLIKNDEDYEEAYHSFHQAAIQHHTRAKYNLGLLNFHGKGVPKNLDESYHWFREAAKYGNENAQKALKSTRVLREIKKNTKDHDVPKFDTELVNKMNAEQRFWFASAVVAMVMADDHIDLHERSFLHSAIRLVKDFDKIQVIEEYILRWQMPPIQAVEFDQKDQDHVLESLLNIATVDRNFDEREEALLREIAESMKISENKIENLIKIGHKRVEQFRANQLRAPNVRARL